MDITFECDACGLRIRSPVRFAGRRTACPQCRADISVPAAVALQEDASASARRPPPPLPPQALADLPTATVLSFWGAHRRFVHASSVMLVILITAVGGTLVGVGTFRMLRNDRHRAIASAPPSNEIPEQLAALFQTVPRNQEPPRTADADAREQLNRVAEQKRLQDERTRVARLQELRWQGAINRAKDVIQRNSRYVARCAQPTAFYQGVTFREMSTASDGGFYLTYDFHYQGFFTGNAHEIRLVFRFNNKGGFAEEIRAVSHTLGLFTPLLRRGRQQSPGLGRQTEDD